MKIKIIHYPYYKHQIGDVVDLGDEINTSLVSFNRAVWADNKEPNPVLTSVRRTAQIATNQLKDKLSSEQKEVEELKQVLVSSSTAKKDILQNQLRQQIQAQKTAKKS